jgi:DNA segregation ATPase FtsK/SpoIIIE-like protein
VSNKRTRRAKRSPVRPRRQKPTKNKPPTPLTRDTAVINWVLGWPGHVKQGFAACILLFFTILLAVGLLMPPRSQNPLAVLGIAFYQLFGWGVYLLVIGLAALALANLAEAAAHIKLVRLGLIVQLTILGCLLLLESHLLLGGDTGQLLGELLARPLAGFPSLAQQIIVVGGIVILPLFIFHISWSQMLLALRWLFGGLGALGSAGFGALTATREASRARRAARMLAEGLPDEDHDISQDGALFEEEEDLASLALQLAPTPPAAAARAETGQAGQVDQQTRPEKATRGSSIPTGATTADLDAIPPLPPLPTNARPAAAGRYGLPAISLLNGAVEQRLRSQEKVIEDLARRVERTLHSFRVEAEVRRADISIGPTVIRIGIRPLEVVKKDYRGHVVRGDDGQPIIVRTKVSRILALQNDLALDLEAKSIRMDAPVPGRPYVGVEIPNKQGRLVTLREILESKAYEESRRTSRLTIALGRDVAGQARVGDLARFPHLLIAGATGSGKSVCLSSIIACMLMQATPDEARFLMVDPKMVELTVFNGIPHLLAPVVTEVDRVVGTLQRGISEMERRYRLFSQLGVRNLDAYRKLRKERPELEALPNIVIVIDELADLMMAAPDEVESLICRLAQLARATGIHLVVATQRPSVDVITGLIKANFPTRISFMVSSATDSRTILDMGGAERLLGKGDMLYLPADEGKPERIQGTYLSDDELERIVTHWRQAPRPNSPGPSWEPGKDDTKQHTPDDGPARAEHDGLPKT